MIQLGYQDMQYKNGFLVCQNNQLFIVFIGHGTNSGQQHYYQQTNIDRGAELHIYLQLLYNMLLNQYG